MNRSELFNRIRDMCSKRITTEWITSVVTKDGNTQMSEKKVVSKITEVLDEMKLVYTRAGSQQPKDLRNIGDIGLDIEIKKTDSTKVYFNDTCPSDDIYYIIVYTCSKCPQILYLNGSEFLKDCDWIYEYNKEIEALKNKYGRGSNKKQLTGILSVYPRPTYTADIKKFLLLSPLYHIYNLPNGKCIVNDSSDFEISKELSKRIRKEDIIITQNDSTKFREMKLDVEFGSQVIQRSLLDLEFGLPISFLYTGVCDHDISSVLIKYRTLMTAKGIIWIVIPNKHKSQIERSFNVIDSIYGHNRKMITCIIKT